MIDYKSVVESLVESMKQKGIPIKFVIDEQYLNWKSTDEDINPVYFIVTQSIIVLRIGAMTFKEEHNPHITNETYKRLLESVFIHIATQK